MNLFLGVFRPRKSQDNLWDISTDHYMHNRDADVLSSFFASHYTRWWKPDVFRVLPLPYELGKRVTTSRLFFKMRANTNFVTHLCSIVPS